MCKGVNVKRCKCLFLRRAPGPHSKMHRRGHELLLKPPIQLYGKTVYQQRNIGFFSDTSIGYYYSGQLAKAKRLNPHCAELMGTINAQFGTKFNGILVNHYEDGNNYISDHSDDEKNLDPGGVIAISYGAERKFRIRDKVTKSIVMDVPTTSNGLIHMGGDFQKEFTHGIPVEKKVQGARYSLTFRTHTVKPRLDGYFKVILGECIPGLFKFFRLKRPHRTEAV